MILFIFDTSGNVCVGLAVDPPEPKAVCTGFYMFLNQNVDFCARFLVTSCLGCQPHALLKCALKGKEYF